MDWNPLLIFDLGNVIIRHDDDLLFKGLSGACANPSTALRLLRDIFRKGGADLMSTNLFFESIRHKIGYTGDYDHFQSIWCSHFSRDPAMEELVAALAAKYQLVILSNTNDAHWKFLTGSYDVLKVPRALYTSFELGMEKPSLEIYEYVLKAEHRTAEETIFVDDRQQNVDGARAAGIHGILFTGREALIRDLAELGVSA
jgi:putative hydrolase of the HAD superfamily